MDIGSFLFSENPADTPASNITCSQESNISNNHEVSANIPANEDVCIDSNDNKQPAHSGHIDTLTESDPMQDDVSQYVKTNVGDELSISLQNDCNTEGVAEVNNTLVQDEITASAVADCRDADRALDGLRNQHDIQDEAESQTKKYKNCSEVMDKATDPITAPYESPVKVLVNEDNRTTISASPVTDEGYEGMTEQMPEEEIQSLKEKIYDDNIEVIDSIDQSTTMFNIAHSDGSVYCTSEKMTFYPSGNVHIPTQV